MEIQINDLENYCIKSAYGKCAVYRDFNYPEQCRQPLWFVDCVEDGVWVNRGVFDEHDLPLALACAKELLS